MTTTHLHCTCERVRIDVERAPILSAECHCTSCRTAGARLGTLAPNGGTRFVLYRKDRVRFVAGAELLREYRLSPTAKTRRVVASCCNTPVFLEFEKGHWISMYAALWPEATRPAPAMRTMTSDLADPSVLPADIPNSKSQPASFMFKLLGAWIAMGFRVPKIAVSGALEVSEADRSGRGS